MNKQKGYIEDLVITIAVICLLAGIWAGGCIISDLRCKAQAEAMGLKATWGPMKGCMVEVTPAKWIPLDKYRFLGDRTKP